jgi:hypothetical protein
VVEEIAFCVDAQNEYGTYIGGDLKRLLRGVRGLGDRRLRQGYGFLDCLLAWHGSTSLL